MPKKLAGFQKKAVLVTGARGSLGEAVVSKFLTTDSIVIGVDLNIETKSSLLQDPKQKNLRWIQMDGSRTESVKKAIELISGQGYEISTLVHCMGGFRFSYLENTTDDELDFLFNVNLKSAFLITREILPGMRKRDYGRIIYVSSYSTYQPPAGMAAYAASKAGVNALVRSLADEVKQNDITVNAVLPSIIDTPPNRKAMPKSDFSKWVKPESLADIIYSLTQPWGSAITGSLIPVTGRV